MQSRHRVRTGSMSPLVSFSSIATPPQLAEGRSHLRVLPLEVQGQPQHGPRGSHLASPRLGGDSAGRLELP